MIKVYEPGACDNLELESRDLAGVKIGEGKVTTRAKNGQMLTVGSKVCVVCESTYEGEDYIKCYDLTKIVKVTAKKSGVPTTVTFEFCDGVIVSIVGAFNISYSGTGPTGLYKILKEAGFDEAVANGVFKTGITEFEAKKF